MNVWSFNRTSYHFSCIICKSVNYSSGTVDVWSSNRTNYHFSCILCKNINFWFSICNLTFGSRLSSSKKICFVKFSSTLRLSASGTVDVWSFNRTSYHFSCILCKSVNFASGTVNVWSFNRASYHFSCIICKSVNYASGYLIFQSYNKLRFFFSDHSLQFLLRYLESNNWYSCRLSKKNYDRRMKIILIK